jgi:hypothetical protein
LIYFLFIATNGSLPAALTLLCVAFIVLFKLKAPVYVFSYPANAHYPLPALPGK